MIILLDIAYGPGPIIRHYWYSNPWLAIIIGVAVLAAAVTAIALIAKTIRKNRGNDKDK